MWARTKRNKFEQKMDEAKIEEAQKVTKSQKRKVEVAYVGTAWKLNPAGVAELPQPKPKTQKRKVEVAYIGTAWRLNSDGALELPQPDLNTQEGNAKKHRAKR